MRWLALAAVSAALVPAAHATAGPTLALSVSSGAVVVRGVAFRPREVVRVTLNVEGVATTVRLRATLGGRYVAYYPRVSVDACTDWKVVARGSLGSRARLVPRLSRECPPPPPP